MRFKRLAFVLFLLYTIIINNSTEIFAQDENLSELSEDASLDPIDMSGEAYAEEEIVPAYLDENGNPVIVAKSAVVIDADTGIIVYGKEENAMRYPASVTKVLTALIACEETEPTDEVTFSHEAVYGIGEGSSSIAVREGETLNMEECLHAVLMASANDVCVGVSELIDGSQTAFAERMNEKAKALGALNSHFANSHGYHDENHYTTAYDMAIILKEAVKNEKFMESFSCLTYEIPETNIVDEVRVINHKAKILWPDSPYYYQYIKGAKTGYTSQAGNTLISYAEKDGVKLICCVLADRGINTYTDTSLLFDWAFGQYSQKTLVEQDELALSIPVSQDYNGKTIDLGSVKAGVKEGFSANLPNAVDKDTITISYDVPDNISGGVNAGDIVGKAEIYYGGNLLASLDVTAEETVEIIPEEELIRQEKTEKLKLMLIRGVIGLAVLLVLAFTVHRILNSKLYKHKRKYRKQRKKFRKQRKENKRKKNEGNEGNKESKENKENEENKER